MTEKQKEATRIIEAIGNTTLNECYVPDIILVCRMCESRTELYAVGDCGLRFCRAPRLLLRAANSLVSTETTIDI
jgi:hypothetical protein